MFMQPQTLAPLFALVLALLWAAWRPAAAPALAALGLTALLVSAVAGAARASQRRKDARLTELEQRSQAQQATIDGLERRCAQVEAELRASEERTLLALRGSLDGSWEWDIASGSMQFSPRWKGMLGFESQELGDDRDAWRSRVHDDDRAGFENALNRHLAGADPRFDHEMRLLHKDGSVRHVLSRGIALRNEAGAPYRVIGMDTDVTRLRRFQAILEAIADGTAGAHGEDFFAALAQHFARALDVDCAFIAECVDSPPTRVRTLGYWSADTGLTKNFEFSLRGTPCDAVLNEGRTCFYPEGLAITFPREAGYESYLGMPIVASDGRVLGHLALRDRGPLGDEVLVDRVYRIFLARAAAEIERLQALARLTIAHGGAGGLGTIA